MLKTLIVLTSIPIFVGFWYLFKAKITDIISSAKSMWNIRKLLIQVRVVDRRAYEIAKIIMMIANSVDPISKNHARKIVECCLSEIIFDNKNSDARIYQRLGQALDGAKVVA